MGGHSKGSAFERKIVKCLSEWWTNGERDDVFWRTAGSGAWAHSRRKAGKSTSSNMGDVQAIDKSGEPFMEVCCIELKIGYKKWSFLDMLDKPERGAEQTVEGFFNQLFTETKDCGKMWALLIAKRDMRVPIIAFPRLMYCQIETNFQSPDREVRKLMMRVYPFGKPMMVMRLSDFLAWCPPDFFKDKMYLKEKGD